MSVFFIEAAQPSDIDALVSLERACSTHPWNERHFRAEMDPAYRTRTLALRRFDPESGVVSLVGFCALRRVADEVHIENVGVAVTFRRRGLARRLLVTALSAAARDGAQVAILEVRASNTPARTLYEGLGFKPAGERRQYYSEPVENAVVLLRRLQLPC